MSSTKLSPKSDTTELASGATSVNAPIASVGSEPGVSTYVCDGNTSELLLQWRVDRLGELSGTYQNAAITGQAPSERVDPSRGPLVGTIDGSAITLDIGWSQPLYGSLDDEHLTLNVPQADSTIQAGTCIAATLTAWNTTIAHMNEQVASANQQAAQAIAQQQAQSASAQAQAEQAQHVSQAQQSLAGHIADTENSASTLNTDKSLGGEVDAMQRDYSSEQADYHSEQAATCYEMNADADTVSADADTVNADLDTLDSDVQELQSIDIAAVNTSLSNILTDLSTLQNLNASPDIDPSPAQTVGAKALSSASAAITWAQGKGAAIEASAKQLATTAQQYATTHCS